MSLSLSEILTSNKSIAESEITELITNNELIEKGLYETLIEKEKIEEQEILLLLAQKLNIPFDIIDNNTIDLKITQIIPETMARKDHIIPLFQLGEALTIASSNPCSTELIEELEEILPFQKLEFSYSSSKIQ